MEMLAEYYRRAIKVVVVVLLLIIVLGVLALLITPFSFYGFGGIPLIINGIVGLFLLGPSIILLVIMDDVKAIRKNMQSSKKK